MTYKPTIWVDHVNSGSKYKLKNNSDGTTNIDYAGEIVQQGTRGFKNYEKPWS